MRTIKISFPQIVTDHRQLQVTDEQYESLVEDRIGEAEFIWGNMTELEKNCTEGKEWIGSAISAVYAGCKNGDKVSEQKES